jgi:hypothetical protein
MLWTIEFDQHILIFVVRPHAQPAGEAIALITETIIIRWVHVGFGRIVDHVGESAGFTCVWGGE